MKKFLDLVWTRAARLAPVPVNFVAGFVWPLSPAGGGCLSEDGWGYRFRSCWGYGCASVAEGGCRWFRGPFFRWVSDRFAF